MLTKTINDNTETNAKRIKALDELKRIIPSYHAQLTTEGKLINNNTSAIKDYTKNLMKAAMAQAMIGKIGSITGNQLNHNLLLENRKGNRNYAINKLRALGMNDDREIRTFDIHASRGGNVTMKQGIFDKKTGKLIQEISRDTEDQILAFQKLVLYNDKRIEEETKYISDGNARIEAIRKLAKQQQIDLEEKIIEKEKPNSSKAEKVKKEKKEKDPDDIASRNFSKSRQSSLDAANAAYQKDVNNLNMSLAQKKISQEQYDVYISALNTQHATNLLTIEQNYYTKSTQMAFKDAAKKKELETGQSKNVAQAQQKLEETRIAAEEKYQAVMTQLIDQGKVQQTLTLEQERDAILEVLRGRYDTALQLAQQSGEDESAVDAAYQQARLNILSEYNDKQLAKIKEFEQQKAQARQEYGLDTFEDQLAARQQKINDDHAKGLLTEQEHQQALANLDREAEEHRLQIRQQYGLATQQELYNAELEMLQLHLQNKEISQQEYEEAVKNLKIQKAKEAFDYYAGLASGAGKALQDAEMANVDAKYDAEIEAAKNTGEDTTEIEKKKANEKLKIQKKYADVNFAIKASQIIADTAVSIMKALGELGPIAGPIAAALMGVTGVAQLAAANAERQKVKRMSLNGAGGSASASASGARVATGLESGGSIDIEREQDGKLFHAAYDPDRRGFINKPTVIVGEGGYGHSKEWVASNAAVENPTVAPIIDIIDRAQRAGKIRTLDMNKFLIQQASGRVSGGHIIPTTSDVRGIAQDPLQDPLIKRLTDVLDNISTNGIAASVALNELEQKQQLRDKARKYGSKS